MIELLCRISWGAVYALICYLIGYFCLDFFKISLPGWIKLGINILLGASILCLQLVLLALIHLPFHGLLLYGPWLVLFVWKSLHYLQHNQPIDLATRLKSYLLSRYRNFLNLTILEKLLLGFLVYLIYMIVVSQITAPFDSYDGTAMWLFKAKHFYLTSSLDQSFFVQNNTSSHYDYPLAFPLMIVSFYTLGTGIEEQLVLVLNSLFMLISVALLFGFARRKLPLSISLCLPIILLTNPAVFILNYGKAYGGYVDYPIGVGMLFFAVCFTLWVEFRQPGYLSLCLIAGTLTASLKNEGLTFFLLSALAIGFILLINFREILFQIKSKAVVAAAVISLLAVLGWNINTKINNYVTDISTGFSLDRFLELYPKRMPTITSMLGSYYSSDIKLIIIPLILLISIFSAALIRNRYTLALVLLTGVLLGQAGLYLFIYVVTPNPLEWHISTTSVRLTAQLMPLVFFIFCLALANYQTLLAKIELTASEGTNQFDYNAQYNTRT